MKPLKKDRRISILLDAELQDKLRLLARRENRPVAGLVRHLIRLAVRDFEAANGPLSR